MYRFDLLHSHAVTREFAARIPPMLLLVPSNMEVNGGYVVRGPTTGRLLHVASALTMAVVLDLEWNPRLLDLVLFDDVLSSGGPSWAERIADRLDGECAPDLLLKADVGGRIMEQAVTIRPSTGLGDLALPDGRGAERRTYLDKGVTWGLVTDEYVDPVRSATLAFLSYSAEQPVPVAAREAVRGAIARFDPSVSVVTILLQAALDAGVPATIAGAAFGQMVASREIEIDINGGAICTDRPITHRSGIWPVEIQDAWRKAMHHSDAVSSSLVTA